MRAGRLDRTITVQRRSATTDEMGTPIETWATVATVRGQRVKLSNDEFLRTFGTTSESVALFRIRHMDGLTLLDRITCDGTTYDLKGIEPIGRRHGLDLRCVASGA